MLMRITGSTAAVTSVVPVRRVQPMTIDAREIWDGDPQRRTREPRIETVFHERMAMPRNANAAIQAYRDCDAAAIAPLLQGVYA